jgi:hypothetical protein
MAKINKIKLFAISLSLLASTLNPFSARAEEALEKAGVAIGMTAGNMVVIPAKAISTSMGLLFGSLALVLSGGDTELTRQMWRDTTEGPYLVTPKVAKKAIGERPELLERK